MKKILVSILVLLVFGSTSILLWRTRDPAIPAQTTTPSSSATQGAASGTDAAAAEPAPTQEERLKAEGLAAGIMAHEAKRFSTDRIAAEYQKSSNAQERWLVLAELQDRRFPRGDAIRLLKSALVDPDLKVRVYAADLLYKLGSAEGRETLHAALRSAASLPAGEIMNVLNAANILNRNRETIPSDLLLDLQQALGSRWVAGIMAMQGDPKYLPYVMASAQEETIAGSVLNLGVLGAPGGYAFAKSVFETTRNETTKAAAAWTMFRTGGDQAALDYVITIAGHVLANPNGFQDIKPDTVQYAMRGLYATPDERVQKFLRQVVDSPYTNYGNSSLASLFYVQQDYEFVDHYLRNYLQEPKAYPYADTALIGRLVAARNQPALNELAERAGAGFREAYFEPMRGLPPESWISLYLNDLPLHLKNESKGSSP